MNDRTAHNRDVAAHWPILAPALVVYGAIAPSLQYTLAIVLALLGTKLLDAVGERHQPRLLFHIFRPLPVFLSVFAFTTQFFPSENIGVGWMFAACGICSLFICISSDEARTMRFIVSILLTLLAASTLAHFGDTEFWNDKEALADAFLFFVMLELVRPHRSSLQQDPLFLDYLLSLTIALVASFSIESWAIAVCGVLIPTIGFAIQNHRRSTLLQGRELDNEDPLQPMDDDKPTSRRQPVGALAVLSSSAASLAILLYLALAFTPSWIDRVDTSIPLIRYFASTAEELGEQSKLNRPDVDRYVNQEQVRHHVQDLYQKLQQFRSQQHESPLTHKPDRSTPDLPTGSVPDAVPDASPPRHSAPPEDLASATPVSNQPDPSPRQAEKSPSIAPVPAESRSNRPLPPHAKRQAPTVDQLAHNLGDSSMQPTTDPPLPPTAAPTAADSAEADFPQYANVVEDQQLPTVQNKSVPQGDNEVRRSNPSKDSVSENSTAPTLESPGSEPRETRPSIASSAPTRPSPSNLAPDSLSALSLYPPTIGSEQFTLDHTVYRQSNDAILMTVSLSARSEAPQYLYLRSGILDTVDTAGFETEQRDAVTLPLDLGVGQTPAPEGFTPRRRTRNDVTITTRSRLDGAIPMPESFTSIGAPGISKLAYHPGDRLIYTTDPYSNLAYQLNGVDFNSPPAHKFSHSAIARLRQRLTDLPISQADKAELKAFAHRIVGSRPSTSEFAEAVSEYFQTNHLYSHEFIVPTGDQHPVVRWLKNGSSGICSHFTSAFTLLARSVDIPARIVTGYLSYEYDAEQRRFIIRAENAHAWVEYLDEANRWVRFDPTPPDTSGAPQRLQQESLVETLEALAPVAMPEHRDTALGSEVVAELAPTENPQELATLEEADTISAAQGADENASSLTPEGRPDESKLPQSTPHQIANNTEVPPPSSSPSAENQETIRIAPASETAPQSEPPLDVSQIGPEPAAPAPSEARASTPEFPAPPTPTPLPNPQTDLLPSASPKSGVGPEKASKASIDAPSSPNSHHPENTPPTATDGGSVHVPQLLLFLALILLIALGLPHLARSLTRRVQSVPETRHRSLAGKLLNKVEKLIREKELQKQPQWESLRDDLLYQRYGREVEPTALQRLSTQFKEQCAALSSDRKHGRPTPL